MTAPISSGPISGDAILIKVFFRLYTSYYTILDRLTQASFEGRHYCEQDHMSSYYYYNDLK